MISSHLLSNRDLRMLASKNNGLSVVLLVNPRYLEIKFSL